jgi:hypothetical protein
MSDLGDQMRNAMITAQEVSKKHPPKPHNPVVAPKV